MAKPLGLVHVDRVPTSRRRLALGDASRSSPAGSGSATRDSRGTALSSPVWPTPWPASTVSKGVACIPWRTGSPSITDPKAPWRTDSWSAWSKPSAKLKAAGLFRAEPSTLAQAPNENGPIVVASLGKRLGYLALAGGGFAMTLVAVAVPGIPVTPWLLATSTFLARSSPRLNERLQRTAFFGPILQDWDGYGGLSRSSKGKLTGLTVTIAVVTIVFAPLTPVTLLLIVFVSSLGIYGIARMPGLPEKPQNGLWHAERAQPALPAP